MPRTRATSASGRRTGWERPIPGQPERYPRAWTWNGRPPSVPSHDRVDIAVRRNRALLARRYRSPRRPASRRGAGPRVFPEPWSTRRPIARWFRPPSCTSASRCMAGLRVAAVAMMTEKDSGSGTRAGTRTHRRRPSSPSTAPRSGPRQLDAGDSPFAVGRGDVGEHRPRRGRRDRRGRQPTGTAGTGAPGYCHLPRRHLPAVAISRAPSSPAAPVTRVSPGRRCRSRRCRTVMRWGDGWCSSTRPPRWR